MDTLWHTLLVVYIVSGIIVGVGLLWLHETVYQQLRKSGRLTRPKSQVKYVALLLILVLVPVVNTFCVIFAGRSFFRSISPS
jgi:hypothetical protein